MAAMFGDDSLVELINCSATGGARVAEVFGDRHDFAIEAGVEPELKPPSAVWGHMCVWCRGAPLGDIEDRYCALYPAYRGFRSLLSPVHGEPTLDRLWAEEFAGLGDLAVLDFLDGLLYGYHGDVEVPDERTAEQCRRDAVVWGCFDFLTGWGEPFDGCKAFILRPPGGQVRILSRDLPESLAPGVEASRGGVVAAVTGFTAWFNEQARRLQGG